MRMQRNIIIREHVRYNKYHTDIKNQSYKYLFFPHMKKKKECNAASNNTYFISQA